MTVICYDGKLIATDGRSTRGSELISDNVDKFFKFVHPEYGNVVSAFCGTMLTMEPWIEHIEEYGFSEFALPGGEGPMGSMFDAMGVMIVPGTKKKEPILIEFITDGLWSTVQNPTAWGSGMTVAQHYLTTGSDAITAVREACRTDTSCGGKITSYDPYTGKFEVHEQ